MNVTNPVYMKRDAEDEDEDENEPLRGGVIFTGETVKTIFLLSIHFILQVTDVEFESVTGEVNKLYSCLSQWSL